MSGRGPVRFVVSAISIAAVLTACGGGEGASPNSSAPPAPTPSSGAAPWPRPADPLSLIEKAGLTPAVREFFTFHVHAHLDVFVNGEPVPVPGGIGINIADPEVHRGDFAGAPTYGGIKRCSGPCISPLHTHDITGVIHIEAPSETTFTLGEFFTEWDVRLDRSCVGGYCGPSTSVAVFVDGKRWSGNPAEILLSAHQEIAVVIGTPPTSIPDSYEFAAGE